MSAWRSRVSTGVLTAVLIAASPAVAEVAAVSETGFQVRSEATVSAAPAAVYAAFSEIARWWDGRHTYSGDAANLSLSLAPGGCFCEALGEGGVRHGEVMLAWPGRMVVLDAALGPLQQTGASGALTFSFEATAEGTRIVQTYNVGGMAPGLPAQWAPAVDQVQGVQLARLARFVDAGAPE